MSAAYNFGEELKKQNEFVDNYILENFGELPEDEEFAQSEALKTYYKLQGYDFSGEREEKFILPESPKG